MAWTLIKRDESQKIVLLTAQDYVFGRKEADIIFSDDMSISRMHSIIRVEYSPANMSLPPRIPIVTIKDTSKYGTTVNGRKLESGGASSFLNSNDIILFGIFENIWKITYTPFVCATSGLSKSDKLLVTQNIVRIGGHIVNEWSDDITHLIMSKIFMSMKVINALVSGAPILMPTYLEEVVSEKSWPVNLKKYESPAVKSSFYSEDANFQPDARRKNIFTDKHFYIFSSKQEVKFKFSITKTGGKLTSILPSNITEDLICNAKSCFLEPSKDSIGNSSFIKLINLLRRNGSRFISEAEIGLSILVCSTEKYCNPKAPGDRLLLGSIPETQFSNESSPFSGSESLVENTLMDFENTKTVIKPSTTKNEIKEQREIHTKAPNEIDIKAQIPTKATNKMQKDTPRRMQDEIDTIKAPCEMSKNNKEQNEMPPKKKVKLEADFEIKMDHSTVPEVSEKNANKKINFAAEKLRENPQSMEVDEEVNPKFYNSSSEKKVSPALYKMFSDKFICARNGENKIKSEESNLALIKIKIQPMTRSNQSNNSTSFCTNTIANQSGNKWQKTFKKVLPKTCYSRVSFEISRSKRLK